jgi:hypothetical protein
MRILARKYRINAPTGNRISGHRKCLSVTSAHRETKPEITAVPISSSASDATM